jgi:hypothetical protein
MNILILSCIFWFQPRVVDRHDDRLHGLIPTQYIFALTINPPPPSGEFHEIPLTAGVHVKHQTSSENR